MSDVTGGSESDTDGPFLLSMLRWPLFPSSAMAEIELLPFGLEMPVFVGEFGMQGDTLVVPEVSRSFAAYESEDSASTSPTLQIMVVPNSRPAPSMLWSTLFRSNSWQRCLARRIRRRSILLVVVLSHRSVLGPSIHG
jgi:hypothetical protein